MYYRLTICESCIEFLNSLLPALLFIRSFLQCFVFQNVLKAQTMHTATCEADENPPMTSSPSTQALHQIPFSHQSSMSYFPTLPPSDPSIHVEPGKSGSGKVDDNVILASHALLQLSTSPMKVSTTSSIENVISRPLVSPQALASNRKMSRELICSTSFVADTSDKDSGFVADISDKGTIFVADCSGVDNSDNGTSTLNLNDICSDTSFLGSQSVPVSDNKLAVPQIPVALSQSALNTSCKSKRKTNAGENGGQVKRNSSGSVVRAKEAGGRRKKKRSGDITVTTVDFGSTIGSADVGQQHQQVKTQQYQQQQQQQQHQQQQQQQQQQQPQQQPQQQQPQQQQQPHQQQHQQLHQPQQHLPQQRQQPQQQPLQHQQNQDQLLLAIQQNQLYHQSSDHQGHLHLKHVSVETPNPSNNSSFSMSSAPISPHNAVTKLKHGDNTVNIVCKKGSISVSSPKVRPVTTSQQQEDENKAVVKPACEDFQTFRIKGNAISKVVSLAENTLNGESSPLPLQSSCDPAPPPPQLPPPVMLTHPTVIADGTMSCTSKIRAISMVINNTNSLNRINEKQHIGDSTQKQNTSHHLHTNRRPNKNIKNGKAYKKGNMGAGAGGGLKTCYTSIRNNSFSPKKKKVATTSSIYTDADSPPSIMKDVSSLSSSRCSNSGESGDDAPPSHSSPISGCKRFKEVRSPCSKKMKVKFNFKKTPTKKKGTNTEQVFKQSSRVDENSHPQSDNVSNADHSECIGALHQRSEVPSILNQQSSHPSIVQHDTHSNTSTSTIHSTSSTDLREADLSSPGTDYSSHAGSPSSRSGKSNGRTKKKAKRQRSFSKMMSNVDVANLLNGIDYS